MLTQYASKLIIHGSAMNALYVTRNFFGVDLYTLDGLISDFIDTLERGEIQEWAEEIAERECFLSYDYDSPEGEVSFRLADF